MTVLITLSCDGTWPGDMACRGALSVAAVSFPEARHRAREQGWRFGEVNRDLCPAHAARAAS